jgi:hypothetical protein
MPSNATPRAEPAISRDPTPNGSAASDSTATPASAPTETAGNAAHPRAATYDVFVSHSSKDKSQADTLCVALEGAGLRCWIAPRDIDPGRKWDESIMDGIASSRVVLLVHSANANASDDVEREIVHASNAELPVLPVRLEDVQLSKSMSYHLVQAQWLDAFPPPIDAHLAMVVEAVQELVRRPPGSTAAFATPDTGAATSGRGTRPPLLRDLVALPALVALDVVVGVWVALNARGAIEWVTANAAIGGLIALLWKMLPSQTTDRARYDFARVLSSRKVALSLTATCIVFLVSTAFVSTVHVSADPSSAGVSGSQMLPATIHVHEPTDDNLDRPTDAEPNTLVVDSLRLHTWRDEHSAFVPISPLGRRVFLEASPQHRTRDVRLVPWVPRRVVYPADFETPTLSVLPFGTLLTDIFALPKVTVYRRRASDSVMVGQATLRSMGAMQFSIASPPPPDSATRTRWARDVRSRLGIDEATANDAVAAWMDRRWIRTREPLEMGDRVRVVVMSGDRILSSDTLTLTASATDVYLTRRP